MTAFSSRWGPDTPAPNQDIGTFFLTDDGRMAGLNAPPLIVLYDPPTSAASGVVMDIDFNETFTIEARDAAGAILQSVVIKAGDPNTGDGMATRWSIDRESADIHSIRFIGRRTAAGGFGLGFDNFCSRSSASGALLTLSLDASVLFDFDQAALRPEADATLRSAAEQIAKYPGTQLTVEATPTASARPRTTRSSRSDEQPSSSSDSGPCCQLASSRSRVSVTATLARLPTTRRLPVVDETGGWRFACRLHPAVWISVNHPNAMSFGPRLSSRPHAEREDRPVPARS
jgi:hypothetical protein